MPNGRGLAEIKIPGKESAKGQPLDFSAQKASPKEDRRKKTEYDGAGAMVHVQVVPWPTRYEFYAHFSAQVAEWWKKEGDAVPFESYYSYMPQYDQMNANQKAYYLYWRSCVRKGTYLPADSSYIILYLYEVLNMSDVLPPADAVHAMAGVWTAYRKDYPYLDKYAGEWICDLLLIHHLTADPKKMEKIFYDALPFLTLPEAFVAGSREFLSAAIRFLAESAVRKSTYYEGKMKAVWDEHIPKAVLYALEECSTETLLSSVYPMRVSRDSFSGAVVKNNLKYEIEVQYRPFLKSKSFLTLIQNLEKCAENELRQAVGIPSKYKRVTVDSVFRERVHSYFDRVFPNRKKKAEENDAEDYLRYYEPENRGPADAARAAEIENAAWQTAIDLGETEELHEETIKKEALPASVVPAESGGKEEGDVFSSFFRKLKEPERQIVAAALHGAFKEKCRELKILPGEAERRINECSADTVGDAVLENGEIIEDYREDLEQKMKEGE